MLQEDGNLVIYTTVSPIRAIWAADTRGKGGIKLCMQLDGNLVLYTATMSPVWSSNTFYPEAYAEMQYDGQLAVWQNGISRYVSGTTAACVSP